jgi:hypothetical protein
MRASRALFGLGLLASFAGCNAILGNESEYTLGSAGTSPDTAGGAGDESGGTAGSAGKGGGAGKGGSSNAGRGGSSGKGGSSNTGGSVSGSGNTDPGGAAGESGQGGAGAGGEGGQPACVPSGAEECFNGRDDDCNELTDCADPACDESIAQCVPVPDDAKLGSLNDPLGCTQQTLAVTLYDGLSGPSECQGCTCQPETSRCDTGIYGYGTYTCGGFQFNGLLYNVFNDSCSQIPADPNIHYYSVRGLSTCTAVGTSAPPPVSWTSTATFCASELLGGGCEPGYRCAPAATASVSSCVLLPGVNRDCTTDYPNAVAGAWHEGYEDDRTCSQCQCGFGLPECVGANLQVYSDPTCSGSPISLGGAEGSACPLAFAPQSARISGTPASNTCPTQVYPSGSFEPTDPRTVCCQ